MFELSVVLSDCPGLMVPCTWSRLPTRACSMARAGWLRAAAAAASTRWTASSHSSSCTAAAAVQHIWHYQQAAATGARAAARKLLLAFAKWLSQTTTSSCPVVSKANSLP